MDDSARSLFRRIAGATDNSALAAECVYRIGESWLSYREYVNAQSAFEEVKNTFDGVEDWYTLSLIGLGECYEKSNNISKARETYQTVIILHPEDDFGTTAQSRLKRLRKE
jgi:TolA-binding protein